MADMTSGNTVPDRYVVVIGGMNMDICGRPTSTVVDRDSNPGVVSMSAGGVGQNIAQNMLIWACDIPDHRLRRR